MAAEDEFVEETPEGADMHQPGQTEDEPAEAGEHGARGQAERGDASGDTDVDPALDPGGGVDPL